MGINRADLLQVAGVYPPPPDLREREGESGGSTRLSREDVPGLEVAGVVVEGGQQTSAASPIPVGTRVAALVTNGAFAQEVVVPTCTVLETERIPGLRDAPFTTLAAVPETYTTAWQVLQGHTRPFLQAVSPASPLRVLIHAAASGVGLSLAHLLQAARTTSGAGDSSIVIHGTVGSEEKAALLRTELGFDAVAVRTDATPWHRQLRPSSTSPRYDLIVDPVGASYFADNVSSLAPGGVLHLLAFLGGHRTPDPISLASFVNKGITVTGSTLRSKPPSFKRTLIQDFAAFATSTSMFASPTSSSSNVHPLPRIDARFDVSQVDDALALLKSNQNIGKVVLEWGDSFSTDKWL
jgi:NADPH:quinone reductase-like Zn-dependent oxidoreductase